MKAARLGIRIRVFDDADAAQRDLDGQVVLLGARDFTEWQPMHEFMSNVKRYCVPASNRRRSGPVTDRDQRHGSATSRSPVDDPRRVHRHYHRGIVEAATGREIERLLVDG
jgi:hypothetical protein